MLWMDNYIHVKQRRAITHRILNANGGLAETPLKLGFEEKSHPIKS